MSHPNELVEPKETPLRAYTRMLRQVHDLIAQGKGDSQEAEALADQMDSPWYAMSAQEQELVGGLSEDLYALAEGKVKSVEMTPQQVEQWRQGVSEAWEAIQTGDVDRALSFLRRPIPRNLPPYIIPFLQARCWEKIGDLETAIQLMQEAERLNPPEAISVLILLQRAGRVDEAEAYAKRIIENPAATPSDLYLAAVTLLERTRGVESTPQVRPLLEPIVAALKRALEVESRTPRDQREFSDLEVLIAFALGLCHQGLADPRSAITLYTNVLKNRPEDAGLLTARGIVLLEVGEPMPALRDFARAAQAGTTSVWPYYFLATHALERDLWHEALRQSIRGTQCLASPQVQAELFEWIAICQSMLRQPLEYVIENFDRALALDPANERIRANRALAIHRYSTPRSSSLPRWRMTKPRNAGKAVAALRPEVALQLDRVNERRATRFAESALGRV